MKLVIANKNYSSWSLRPWVLMTALGIPFEEEQVPFAGLDNYDEFRRFSPSGQVPVLIDGARTIWDSLAITLYLGERFPAVWPSDADARAWAMCAAAEMHGGFSALRSDCCMNVGVRVSPRPPRPALQRDVARIAELFEEGLTRFGGPFLAGADFTAADAFFAPVVFRIRTYGLAMGPLGSAWVERMLALPAMRAWEEAALAETYREEGHEDELAAAGLITADFRTTTQTC
ncbi:glutathione S-transferase family protein [Sphingomonas astaxanthinifaciens]|uniref:Glutathione S-transferase n=1 Tax=Sphingomonas astaxanthinifaciens DSM 22298 TaxID=1123267 RepID=A0ABQ5Z740_9SPHN|nr:glutathione S-transferase family protein [Sphingomonas astaxanthinifaciens]GLR47465.1 glutathione S-transferase [Sphingomonas astaxanthinifaciens DSM 22298]